MNAVPAYATRPTPGALHDLAACRRVGQMLRRPLMPWMETVLRVATERRLDDPRRFRYREVRLSVPRQSGKTTVVHVKNVQRTLARPRMQAFYTAQTGKDARARWHDARMLVEDSPLKEFVRPGNTYGGSIRLAAGETGIIWPSLARLSPFAPTPASLHGYTPESVDEDEVWEYDELQGQALDGAIGPAQITLAGAQRWLLSTMGDATSTYWHRLVDEGRAATQDPDAQIAYFEWSAPAGADLYDPDVWASFHPALGHTIDLQDLAAEARKQPAGTWQRAYCNLKTAGRETMIDLDLFDKRGNAQLTFPSKGAVLAYDVSHDGERGAAALARATGENVSVRIVWEGPAAELPGRVMDLAAQWSLPHVYADDGGLTRDTTDVIRRAGREVHTTNGPQFATATGAWIRRAKDGRLEHDGSALLRDAQAAAVTRPMGDADAFSRSRSAGPIHALVAAAVAVRAAILEPAAAPAPMTRV